ncbi:MAG: hypothetical protein FD132_777 [bacterium]|nr:MAG: hypothetical protein FD132_777 [bacterium]
MRQAVAQVAAGDGDHQTQMRQHQLAGGFEIVVLAQAGGQIALLLRAQQREAVDRLDVVLQAAQGGRYGEVQGLCGHVNTSLIQSSKV